MTEWSCCLLRRANNLISSFAELPKRPRALSLLRGSDTLCVTLRRRGVAVPAEQAMVKRQQVTSGVCQGWEASSHVRHKLQCPQRVSWPREALTDCRVGNQCSYFSVEGSEAQGERRLQSQARSSTPTISIAAVMPLPGAR